MNVTRSTIPAQQRNLTDEERSAIQDAKTKADERVKRLSSTELLRHDEVDQYRLKTLNDVFEEYATIHHKHNWLVAR